MIVGGEPSGDNPFVRYRARLDSYRRWVEAGGDDAAFVAMVVALDSEIAAVEGRPGGRGFTVTPTTKQTALATACGLDSGVTLLVKDETQNVSGSHKARHLFGLALHGGVDSLSGTPDDRELVIASCGNAALGAAVVAKAARRALRVFIPVWADENVVVELERLGARIERCERRDGEAGDPCYLRFREAVAAGSEAFSVQGSDVPRTLDGGRTIGWELVDQLTATSGGDVEAGGAARLDHVFVQVGGGALGACVAAGLHDGVVSGVLAAMPRIHAVQTVAAAPLQRAWKLLTAQPDPLGTLRAGRDLEGFMWPWDDVGESAASGILDDVTYDWVPLTEAMLQSGGGPVVVTEAQILAALDLGRRHTGIDVDATGTAGLAGLLADRAVVAEGEHVAVLFTGRRR